MVKEFHTSPIQTTVRTTSPTNIDSNSAQLNGSFSSKENVTTYFEYREATVDSASPVWKKTSEQIHNLGSASNIYGNIQANVSSLIQGRAYQYRTVGKTSLGSENRTINGSTLNFTANPGEGDYGGGSENRSGDRGSSNNNTNNSGIINTPTLTLGQTNTPPTDAVVHQKEGIETVFARQISANIDFAKIYGYKDTNNIQNFAWNLADKFARVFGYVNSSGKEIRVSYPDLAAYQLQLNQNKLTVYEYYKNKIIDIRDVTTVFKNASGYEYYFKK